MRQVLSLILREVDAFDDTGNRIRPSLQSLLGDKFSHGLAKKSRSPKMKILSTFTNHQVAPNLHDFLNESDDNLKTVSIVF